MIISTRAGFLPSTVPEQCESIADQKRGRKIPRERKVFLIIKANSVLNEPKYIAISTWGTQQKATPSTIRLVWFFSVWADFGH